MSKKLKITAIVVLVWALVIGCLVVWVVKPEEAAIICGGSVVIGAAFYLTFAIVQFLNDELD